MTRLSTVLAKAAASAVVTAAALGGNAIAGTCTAKCGAKQTAAACGACKAKCGACKASSKGAKKAKAAAKCGACKAKCGACGAKK